MRVKRKRGLGTQRGQRRVETTPEPSMDRDGAPPPPARVEPFTRMRAEPFLPLPKVGYHHVKITLEHEHLKAEYACTAPENADCRMQCPNGCEGACSHIKADSGECWMVPWLNECSLEENYAGEPRVLYDGPFRGEWSGDWVELYLEQA